MNKIKNILGSESGVSKIVFGIILVGIFAVIFGPTVYAQFYRTNESKFGFSYGYGYGDDYGYGYGYHQLSGINGYATYGFTGNDGSAVINVISKTQTSIDFDYITTYTATNTVEYGMDGNFDMAFDSKLQSAGIFSNTLTDLTCDTEYNIRVSSEDAGGNIWTNSTTTATSSCDSDKDDDKDGGKGGSSGGSVSPNYQPTSTTLSAEQTASLMAQVQELMKLVNALFEQRGLTAPFSVDSFDSSFDRTLRLLDIGDDVLNLQESLNKLGFTVAQNGPGSIGNETRFFGPLTRDAVMRFQTAQGLVADGIVGPLTRAALLKALGM